MSDKKIKETMKRYIEDQADKAISEVQETPNLSSLDEKVYATLNAKREKKKPHIVWSYKKVTALAASFLLIIGLSIMSIFLFDEPPADMDIQDQLTNTIVISYENEQYGYSSNNVVIDKYDMGAVPDFIVGYLSEENIISVDSIINKDNLIGAEIRPYNENVIIIRGADGDYYFEKIETE